MVEDEVGAGNRTVWCCFRMDETEFIPILQQGLNFLKTKKSRCLGDSPGASSRAKEVGEAAKDLTKVAEKTLKRVQKKLELEGRQLIVPPVNIVMQHILKQIAERGCEGWSS